MPRAKWTPAAEIDLEDIVVYIAEKDGRRATARKIYNEFRARATDFAAAFSSGSTIGTARPDLGEDYRSFSHKRWVVVFRPIGSGIEVLRVFDGSRDYPRLFGH